MVEVISPKCGEKIKGKGTEGRKPKDIHVIFICDTLRSTHSVKQAAEVLGCSQGYIYKVLEAAGLRVQDIISNRTKS